MSQHACMYIAQVKIIFESTYPFKFTHRCTFSQPHYVYWLSITLCPIVATQVHALCPKNC